MAGCARDRTGARGGPLRTLPARNGVWYRSPRTGRRIAVQCGAAHIDHADLARFYDPANLSWECRECHLRRDQRLHVAHAGETRKVNKDAARPCCAFGAIEVTL